MARRLIRGMFSAAIAARAGRQSPQKIDIGEEFNEVARPHRASLHEILSCVTGKASAHKDVQHIMHMQLSHLQRQARAVGQSAGQVGMAAVVILPTMAEEVVRVRVTARADHIMHPAAKIVELIPIERILGDRRKAAQVRQAGPHPVTRA
jgi:hypothetical protein